MNIKILYAARKEFNPEINYCPALIKGYPFANFLRHYGWERPSLIMQSSQDDTTDLQKIIDQIRFDFGLEKEKEINNLKVCLEKNGKMVGMCSFGELDRHADLNADNGIVLSPDDSAWYMIAYI